MHIQECHVHTTVSYVTSRPAHPLDIDRQINRQMGLVVGGRGAGGGGGE
jgi:hypothetical protein